MPIYEYVCEKCSASFELLVSSSSSSAECPECGSGECERKFSVFGFSSGGKFTSSHGSGCSCCSKSSCQGCK